MREIQDLGIKKENHTRAYRYGLFECPICGAKVEKIHKDGIKAKTCSVECSRSFRGPKSNYKPFVMISGYKYIWSPSHPNANKSGYVAEHRLVIESKIGRYLKKDEEIHHINFNKTDNRIENLMIISSSEHQKLHSSICCVAMRRKKKRSDSK